jgi:uroporphyrinogen decarboxylase
MRLMGGFDKHILMHTKDEIAREIDRLAPLVEEGGYIPMPDHRVPPDVSFANYLYYLDTAKQVWGKGLDNIKPTGTPVGQGRCA